MNVSLETPVEEIGRLEATKCLTGLIPVQQFEEITEQIGELGGAVERIGEADNRYACLIVCLNEQAGDVQKLLRAADFEAVNFESMSGTVADLIEQHDEELEEARKQLQDQYAKASSLSENLLKLEILCDHYANLLEREQTGSAAPTTEQILADWKK